MTSRAGSELLSQVAPGLTTGNASIARAFLEMFAGGPLPEWDSFSRTIKIIRLRPQEILYDVGEDHPYIYLVRRGSMRVGFTDARGRDCLLAFLALYPDDPSLN